jgi:DNA-binding NarL/FixJ family response regulator
VITVLVAAVHAARKRLEAVVAMQSSMRLASRQRPGRESLEREIERARPDVLLLDVGSQGIETALREIRAMPAIPPIVLLTDDLPRGVSPDRFRAGVRAVLPHDAGAREIATAIEAAAAGLLALHPGALPGLARRPPPARAASPSPTEETLSPRELEVLAMMAEGLGNKAIATALGISGHTVKFHLASVFAKLGAGSRTEAVTIGVRRGLVML